MPNVSMTDVVDVFSTAGAPKVTKVSQIKNRPPYEPAFDFYRPLRTGIASVHSNRQDKSNLDNIIDKAHVKKIANYREAISGYKKWWGKKQLDWFDPPRSTYSHSGIDVNVNPELGLAVDGDRYIIKLYMKDEPLTKFTTEPSLALMELSLRHLLAPTDTVAVLDVRNGKLHSFGGRNPQRMKPMVDGELAYIATLWPAV
jgi:hypothetical protein